MGDSEITSISSKKRGAQKELSRDNPGLEDEDDSAELGSGTFKRANEEVLASRRIVKVKRKEPSATAPSSNPFAAIRLVPPSGPSANAVETNSSVPESKSPPTEATDESEKPALDEGRSDGTEENNPQVVNGGEKTGDEGNKVSDEETVKSKVEGAVEEETENVKEESDDQSGKKHDEQTTDAAKDHAADKESAGNQTEKEENGDDGALSSFQQHSSTKNAFTGLAGTSLSPSPFSFPQEGSTASGSVFGQNTDKPTFSFGLSNNGSSSLFGASIPSIITKSENSGFPPKQEVSVETGEENERVAFSANSILFEYIEGAWKERGKGEVKVNVSTTSEKARLVMRARGNYRLILNAGLFPEMKLANMDKKGITFACVNCVGEGKDSLSTFALKFKDPAIAEEFRAAVTQHKDGKAVKAAPLKTPENSPDA